MSFNSVSSTSGTFVKRLKIGAIEVDDAGDITGVSEINGVPYPPAAVPPTIGPFTADSIMTGTGLTYPGNPAIAASSNIRAAEIDDGLIPPTVTARAVSFDNSNVTQASVSFYIPDNSLQMVSATTTANPPTDFGVVQVSPVAANMQVIVASAEANAVTMDATDLNIRSTAGSVYVDSAANNVELKTSSGGNKLSEVVLGQTGINAKFHDQPGNDIRAQCLLEASNVTLRKNLAFPSGTAGEIAIFDTATIVQHNVGGSTVKGQTFARIEQTGTNNNAQADANGVILNTGAFGFLKVDALQTAQYTLPLVDGAAGQYLCTNGAGVLYWGPLP
jgi:hypothetical protein